MTIGFTQDNGLVSIKAMPSSIGMICTVLNCTIQSTPGGVPALATDDQGNTYIPHMIDPMLNILIWRRTQ